MNSKLTFKKAGVRGKKEVDISKILEGVREIEIHSECLKIYKSKGRPKTIYNDWIFETLCKNANLNLKEILNYTEHTRKEILGEFYGKEYIENEDWKTLWKGIEREKIPTYYGH